MFLVLGILKRLASLQNLVSIYVHSKCIYTSILNKRMLNYWLILVKISSLKKCEEMLSIESSHKLLNAFYS